MADSADLATLDPDGKLAHSVIRRHFTSLCRVVTRGDILDLLYSKDILDEDTYDLVNKLQSDKEKGRKIVRAVQKAVLIKVEIFEEFCSILENDTIARDTVKKMRDDYKEDLQKVVDSSNQPSPELVQLKSELQLFNRKLLQENAPRESIFDVIRNSISDYIEMALKAGETAEVLKQQMSLLCHNDFLIPPALHDWVLETVEKCYSALVACEMPPVPPENTKSEAPDEPLFCKEVLYHASLCCHAVCTSMCTPQKLTDFLGPQQQMIYHHLDQASMSVSTEGQDMAPYLIAVEKSTIYVGFRGETSLLDWSKKYASLEEGLKKQAQCIPLRFFVEQLWDKKRIVFTGFSFGGLLAVYMTASIWKMNYIRKDILDKRVICITFGQPIASIRYIKQVAEKFPEFESTIHSVFSTEDVIPHLMWPLTCADVLFPPASKIGNPSSPTPLGLPAPVKNGRPSPPPLAPASVRSGKPTTPPLVSKLPSTSPAVGVQAYDSEMSLQGGSTAHYFRCLANLQESQSSRKYAAAAVRSASASRNSEAVAYVKSVMEAVPPAEAKDLVGKYYEISTEGSKQTPKWNTLSKVKAAQKLGGLSASEIESDDFQDHNMAVYKNNMFRSYLDKNPKYSPPESLKEVESVGFLKPSLTDLEFHKYPNEHVLLLEGDNLWFCHQIQLGEGEHACCIDTPAQHISRRSIQFNYTPSDKCGFVADGQGKVKVNVQSHFASPLNYKMKIKEEPYTFSQRQMQLARHTPSEVIELAYWSAMLECSSSTGTKHDRSPSKRLTAVIKFLEEAVRVVPVESIFYAIAHCDPSTSIECTKAVVQSLSRSYLPPSTTMTTASLSALRRINLEALQQMMEAHVQQINEEASRQPTYSQVTAGGVLNVAMPASAAGLAFLPHLFAQVTIEAILPTFLGPPMPCEAPRLDHSTQGSIVKLLTKISQEGLSMASRSCSLDAVCGYNIERVYPIYPARRTSIHPLSSLRSPIEVLKESRDRLSLFAEEARRDFESIPNEGLASEEISKVDQMLEIVQEIQDNHLKICASLLGAFMELQIRIPLLNNPAATAKLLSSKAAPVAMGVWALFSMSYSELRQMLQCTGRNELLVEIADYISGILDDSDKPSQSRDSMYAGKLQFLLQGMQKKTTCCNSQYISYSLEHQLCKNLKFDPSISVPSMVEQWNEIFEGDALSLVAKPYRALIARWLKWAFLIHNLRESLAEYTCVGVIGLVNSGKSQLVRTLFRVQTLVGTRGKARTTVPFLYNLDGVVDGLDVIDFPGVDDQDHCIPELAQLLLGLAQIVIFVVNYRKVSTDLAKEWLHHLQRQAEGTPLLVCLSHADRLYAECMELEDKNPHPTDFKKQQIGVEHQRIMKELGHHHSRTVEMCYFRQEPDSTLKPEYLREVGIKSPQDVGDWLVKTFRNKFDQTELAKKLDHFIHSPEDM